MSNDLAVSMDELERESAELLPSRETLCVSRWHPAHSGGNSFSFTQVDGNTNQVGLINLALLNGSFDSLF
ncbi:MAG: hypothetical protein ACRDOI_36560 [Trebonia sp.]